MTNANLPDDEFSMLLRPSSLTTTEIEKTSAALYDMVDEIGGFMGAVELGLALFAVMLWLAMSGVDAIDGDYGDEHASP